MARQVPTVNGRSWAPASSSACLSQKMPEQTLIHGTCIAFDAKGILLLGPPGAGKSSLALRLMDEPGFGISGKLKPATLVADDQVILRRDQTRLMAYPPPVLSGLLEIRGIGIVPVTHLHEAEIVLVADLVPVTEIERLPDSAQTHTSLLNIDLPRVRIDASLAAAAARLRAAFDLL